MKTKLNKKLILCLVVAALMVQVSLFAATQPPMPQPTQDIVEIASGDKQFETLVAALQAAGLVDALKGDGPFTVFAPTNDAFNKLPKGTVEQLLKPENKDRLVDLLTYHVYPGKLVASDLMKLNGKEIKMLNGKPAKIKVKNGSVFIDGAKVTTPDVMAKNGVIHVIDTVMIPN